MSVCFIDGWVGVGLLTTNAILYSVTKQERIHYQSKSTTTTTKAILTLQKEGWKRSNNFQQPIDLSYFFVDRFSPQQDDRADRWIIATALTNRGAHRNSPVASRWTTSALSASSGAAISAKYGQRIPFWLFPLYVLVFIGYLQWYYFFTCVSLCSHKTFIWNYLQFKCVCVCVCLCVCIYVEMFVPKGCILTLFFSFALGHTGPIS